MEHVNLRDCTSKEITYIFVIHVPKQLDLSQSAFGVDLIVEGVAYLLDGNLLAGLRVDSGTGQTNNYMRDKYHHI
jgi:hypothetical protein